MNNIMFVEPSFPIDEINPKDGQIVIKLIEDVKNQFISGGLENSIFSINISKCFDNWEYSLMDCISYQLQHNRKIICAINEIDFEKAKSAYKGHSNTDRKLRDYEDRILVHSTMLENWEAIRRCGYLKSWNKAKQDGDIIEIEPIGKQLGDPLEFSDYIMFGKMNFWSEIVVLSKQRGNLIYDPKEVYSPGARIYIDIKKVAEDGLLVRDGIHLKVKEQLALEPYMLWYATAENCHVADNKWTPITFAEAADRTFLEKCKSKVW